MSTPHPLKAADFCRKRKDFTYEKEYFINELVCRHDFNRPFFLK